MTTLKTYSFKRRGRKWSHPCLLASFFHGLLQFQQNNPDNHKGFFKVSINSCRCCRTHLEFCPRPWLAVREESVCGRAPRDGSSSSSSSRLKFVILNIFSPLSVSPPACHKTHWAKNVGCVGAMRAESREMSVVTLAWCLEYSSVATFVSFSSPRGAAWCCDSCPASDHHKAF